MQGYGPRIYNLFPRLVGTVEKWTTHLDRIKEMEFNWIYLNPVNYTGFSGSLYSIKDYFKFNPIFAPENAKDPTSWELFKQFIVKCHDKGLQVMMDLVINHTAIDSDLITDHPDWYKHRIAIIDIPTRNVIRYYELIDLIPLNEYPSDQYEIREQISNPYAIDPADARKITIWGDLAEIDNNGIAKQAEIQEYWKRLLNFYLDLGIDGFRCDAAYQIPSRLWKVLIPYTKTKNPNIIFLAENLGCTLAQLEALSDAGFDFIHSSSKWWDFTQSWCVDQYNAFRKFAPSVSFPENHDTKRLAFESNGREDYQTFRYLFASFFSAGVMISVGYEYGFRDKLDVVGMKPTDWEWPQINISDYIRQVNIFKQSYRLLNEDGPISHFNYHDLNLLVLRKSSLDEKQHMLLIYNKDWGNNHYIKLENLKVYLPLSRPIYQIDITGLKIEYYESGFEFNMNPNQVFLFYQE